MQLNSAQLNATQLNAAQRLVLKGEGSAAVAFGLLEASNVLTFGAGTATSVVSFDGSWRRTRFFGATGYILAVSSLDGVRAKATSGEAVAVFDTSLTPSIDVRFAGDAVAQVLATGGLSFVVPLSGDAIAALLIDAAPVVARTLDGGLPIVFMAPFEASRAAHFAGTSTFGLYSFLHYERTVYASGELLLELIARADVGVEFGSGEAVMTATAILDGNRGRTAPGVSEVVTLFSFAPYAVRRSELAFPIELGSGFDPGWISGGVRYIVAGMTAPTRVVVEGSGLRQVTQFAAVPMTIVATGLTNRRRVGVGTGAMAVEAVAIPALRRVANFHLPVVMSSAFNGLVVTPIGGELLLETRLHPALRAQRFGGATCIIQSAGDVTGAFIHRSTGDAVVTMLAQLTPFVEGRLAGNFGVDVVSHLSPRARRYFVSVGNIELAVEPSGEVFVRGDAEAVLTTLTPFTPSIRRFADAALVSNTVALCDALRTTRFDGSAEISALSEASLFGNIAVPDTETFIRPEEIRVFVRPPEHRVFRR